MEDRTVIIRFKIFNCFIVSPAESFEERVAQPTLREGHSLKGRPPECSQAVFGPAKQNSWPPAQKLLGCSSKGQSQCSGTAGCPEACRSLSSRV